MIALAVPVGAVIGLCLGALGGGGSILTVPALVYVLGQRPHGATVASLVIVGVTSLSGVAAHLKGGRVRVRQGLVFGVLGSGGSYLGSRLSASIDPNALLAAFAAMVAVAAVAMLRRGGTQRRAAGGEGDGPAASSFPSARCGPGVTAASTALPDARAGRGKASSPQRVVLAASAVGLLTGFFGVGGGFVVVPALVLALRFDMADAVGTSLLVIAVNSGTALLARLSGHAPPLDWPLLVAFCAAAVAGTVAGSRLAALAEPRKLMGAFAVLLLAVAAYTALRSVPRLV